MTQAWIDKKTGKEKRHIIECGSFALTDVQKNYSAIELECLGGQNSMEKCDYYLKGAQFTWETDHKPLESIFRKPPTEIDNMRLVKIREKMLPYHFVVKHVKGSENYVADLLSRDPDMMSMKATDLEDNCRFVDRCRYIEEHK